MTALGDPDWPETQFQQGASSSSFINVLEKELTPQHDTFTHNFLQSILSSLDSRDPVVANAWLETLLDVIDLLPKEVIKRDVLNVVISKGQLSQPVSSRLSCCKMLGKICTKFEAYLIKKEILPLVQSLCQDTDYEVRACMCRQLDIVSRGMGFDAAKVSILPELVELSNDEQVHVRLAGIETVVNLLNFLDDETCSQIIVPLVKNFCQNSLSNEDATLPVIALNLGKLCHSLSVNLTFENKQWFTEYFQQLTQLGLSSGSNPVKDAEHIEVNPMPDLVPLLDTQEKFRECRQNCAYNFPAMVLFTSPQLFFSDMYKMFSNLCSDPHEAVRQTIACGFHEIAKLLGPTIEIIYDELVILLRDNSIEVLKGLIPHLPETLEVFAKESSLVLEHKSPNDIISALIDCETTISKTSNWRLHANFLDKMSCLTRCLSNEVIYANFVPLFIKKLHLARAIPCRISTARTLLTYLKTNRCQEQRDNICTTLVNELCHGRSCRSRSLFIDCCFLVLEMFSKLFFKKYFFKDLLCLASDKVVNIRLRLCSILPQVKSVIKLPSDRELLQLLESSIRELMVNEVDRDVSAAIETMHLSQGTLIDYRIEEDYEDIKKEEEERLIEMGSNKSSDNSSKTATPNKRFTGKIPVRKLETNTKTVTKPTESKLKYSKSSTSLKSLAEKDISPTKTSSKSSLPTKCTIRPSHSSSSISSELNSPRCSIGSLSKIPSPCSSPSLRRQSYDSPQSKIPSFSSSPKLPRASESRPNNINNFLKTSPTGDEKSKLQAYKQSVNPGSTPISNPTDVISSTQPQNKISSQPAKQHVSRIPAPSSCLIINIFTFQILVVDITDDSHEEKPKVSTTKKTLLLSVCSYPQMFTHE
ncbi:Serine/threonine-protein phosphatase 4 regulatory subunit 4 [Nymphon striatum]|nr:Serine/threonine-protein phosphatase 4 regulatory subunit 4 [Nymphon striatum]